MLRIFRKDPDDYSDDELIALYQKSGDSSHLGILYERYTELIYGTCLKILKDELTAQDAFMTAYEQLHIKAKTQKVKEVRPWLYVLVKNHCFQILRKQTKDLTKNYEEEFMQSEPFEHPFSEDLSLEREKALEACLEKLVGQQKECVQLFYYHGKTYKEIAILKSEKVGRIRSFIQNGRRNLGKCIEGILREL